MNVFVDTNVLLSFYHFNQDDLEEIRKLIVAAKSSKVTIHIPQQVIDEFRRNRDGKIAEALRSMKGNKFSANLPRMAKDFADFSALQEHVAHATAAHSALYNKLLEAALAGTLKADEVIAELLGVAKVLPCPDELLARARRRMEIGNPPGKDGRLGDALNWEALLKGVPDEGELFVVTDDGDYASALDEEVINSYLRKEWEETKGADVTLYRRLSAFFQAKFPSIKLAAELEKELLISDFENSSNFRRTHVLVAKLSKVASFSADQANAIATAAVTNSQISSIIDDEDVHSFLETLLKNHMHQMNAITVQVLQNFLTPAEPEDADEIPF